MSIFDKKKDEQDEESPATAVDPAQAPQALMASIESIQQEWDIFQTRLATLFENIKNGAAKSVTKKSMSHAKHAAMCVRDALKEFGRTTL